MYAAKFFSVFLFPFLLTKRCAIDFSHVYLKSGSSSLTGLTQYESQYQPSHQTTLQADIGSSQINCIHRPHRQISTPMPSHGSYHYTTLPLSPGDRDQRNSIFHTPISLIFKSIKREDSIKFPTEGNAPLSCLILR